MKLITNIAGSVTNNKPCEFNFCNDLNNKQTVKYIGESNVGARPITA